MTTIVVLSIASPLCLVLWLLAIDGMRHGRAILSWEPRRIAPWTIREFFLSGAASILILSANLQWVSVSLDLPKERWSLEDLSPDHQMVVIKTFSLASIFAMCATIGVCRLLAGVTARDLGWDPAHWRRDVKYGCGAFVMLLIPMISIHFVARLVWPTQEDHPFHELLLKHPEPRYLIPIAVTALVVAPIVEEFFFRVILQGWLERIASRRFYDHDRAAHSLPRPENDASAVTGNEISTPFDTIHAPPATLATSPHPPGIWGEWMPIVVSSACFAAAHAGQGPAPIPLFFLALGLGYIYQRTHRIIPSITVHFLVNLTAVTEMTAELLQQV